MLIALRKNTLQIQLYSLKLTDKKWDMKLHNTNKIMLQDNNLFEDPFHLQGHES